MTPDAYVFFKFFISSNIYRLPRGFKLEKFRFEKTELHHNKICTKGGISIIEALDFDTHFNIKSKEIHKSVLKAKFGIVESNGWLLITE